MGERKTLQSLKDVSSLEAGKRTLFSASHDEIMAGWTTDIYFIKTREILNHLGLGVTPATAEIFAGQAGLLAGVEEVKNLLGEIGRAHV